MISSVTYFAEWEDYVFFLNIFKYNIVIIVELSYTHVEGKFNMTSDIPRYIPIPWRFLVYRILVLWDFEFITLLLINTIPSFH